jgi:hypothetical protein
MQAEEIRFDVGWNASIRTEGPFYTSLGRSPRLEFEWLAIKG